MANTIHRRLREETREAHQRLEACADVQGRLASPMARGAIVAGFHRLHVDIEAAAGPWVSDLADLEFDARRRTLQLGRDLAALGVRPISPRRSDGVRAGCIGEALGLIYVVEGSTLGGQIIRREAFAAGDDLAGLSFLDPYGPRVGERWRSFLAVLDAAAQTAEDQAAVVRGAHAGFRHAELMLCGAGDGATSDG